MDKFQTHKKILIGLLNASIVTSLGVLFAFYNPVGSLNSHTTPDSLLTNELSALSKVHQKPAQPATTAPTPTPAANQETASAGVGSGEALQVAARPAQDGTNSAGEQAPRSYPSQMTASQQTTPVTTRATGSVQSLGQIPAQLSGDVVTTVSNIERFQPIGLLGR